MSCRQRSRHHSYRVALAILASVASVGSQPSDRLDFTRPTLTAITLKVEPRFHRPIHEDDAYKFVERDYGTDGERATPGFFVYSKRRAAWIQIVALSTEHARLGRSPDDVLLAIGWDYGPMLREPFTSMPLRTSGPVVFPDRIVDSAVQAAYRLDFNSSLDRDVSLTSFWLSKADLDAAFEGRRTPALVDTRHLRGIAFDADTADGLIVPVRVNNGEFLRWRIDTKLRGILVDPDTTHIAVAAGAAEGRVDLAVAEETLSNQLVMLGSASPIKNIGGILGTGFFDRFRVVLDYDHERLWVEDPGMVATREAGEPIRMEWRSGFPVVTAKIVAARSGPIADTRLCIDMNESRPLVLRQRPPGARLPSLRIGTFRFDNLPVAGDDIAEGCDGVIGNGLLRRFRVTLDRRNAGLLLLPGQLLDVPYDYDLTGLTIVANGRALGIAFVAAGTIGASAGFRAGDVILEMDGRAVGGSSLRNVRRSFRHDGGEHVLTIERLGVRQPITLSLPDLR